MQHICIHIRYLELVERAKDAATLRRCNTSGRWTLIKISACQEQPSVVPAERQGVQAVITSYHIYIYIDMYCALHHLWILCFGCLGECRLSEPTGSIIPPFPFKSKTKKRSRNLRDKEAGVLQCKWMEECTPFHRETIELTQAAVAAQIFLCNWKSSLLKLLRFCLDHAG